MWGAATVQGDTGTFVGHHEGLRTLGWDTGTCDGSRAKWCPCEAWQGTKVLVGLMWGPAGGGQSEWGMAKGQRRSGTPVEHKEGLEAQWDPCGACGWAEGTVGPRWGTGTGGQNGFSVRHSED